MKPALYSALLLGIMLPQSSLRAQQAAPQTTPSAPPAASSDLPDSPVAQIHTALQPTGSTVLFDTSMGRISCRFFDQQAPLSVANFVALAQGSKDWKDPVSRQEMHNKPLYDGTVFHRVIPQFMIQGGDPEGNGMGDPGYYVKNETDPNLNFDVAGRLAMANSGPDTNGSQFFITEAPDDELDQKYSIFGQCDEAGVLTVKTIARVQRDGRDKPLSPVTLIKVTIVPEGRPVPPAPALPPPPPPPAPVPAGFGKPQ